MRDFRSGRMLKCVVLGLAMLGGTILAPSMLTAVTPDQEAPPYTLNQSLDGKALYAAKCVSCHGASLEGGAGIPLKGEAFASKWLNGNRTVGDLYNALQRMPLNAPKSLSNDQYVNVLAYLLAENNFVASIRKLQTENFAMLLTPQRASAPAGPPPPPRATFPQAPVGDGQATTARPDDAELAAAHTDNNWLTYNKGLDGARYSQLNQINRDNAAHVKPVCIFQASEIGMFQTSPIIYDGLMYITTPYSTYAVNAATCAKVWEHRYPADMGTTMALSRGAALYKGKVYRVTPNGHLLALDAKTGKQLWDVWMVSKAYGYWLSAAPVAYNGVVVMGTAGADWGANGIIYGFDAETGKKLWSFNVIPTGKETGAETWKKGAERGGGSFWTTFTLDIEKGQVLAPVGNPAPDFNGAMRPGDNLFTNSIVALDMKTGKLAWWAQQVPHDVHDWDTAAAPAIYNQDGRKYMAVANKGGWLYIYDRATRKLLAQPEISPHSNDNAPITLEGTHHCPGNIGGAEWNGPAYSPQNKALYVNTVDWCGVTRLDEQDRYVEGLAYFDGDFTWDPIETAGGFLHSVDAATGKVRWARRFASPMVAGVTPTAGDVLFTGTLGGDFLVLDASDGKTLYSFNTGGSLAGGLSTYTIDGKQYVAAASGNNSRTIWKSGGTMIVAVFALSDK